MSRRSVRAATVEFNTVRVGGAGERGRCWSVWPDSLFYRAVGLAKTKALAEMAENISWNMKKQFVWALVLAFGFTGCGTANLSTSQSYDTSLAALKEPRWPRGHRGESEAYRFTCVPLLPVGFTMMRIEVKKDGSGTLITRVADTPLKQGHRGPVKPVFFDRTSLTVEQIREFKSLIGELDFAPPAHETESLFQGFDGSIWTFEVILAGDYRVISRWTPASPVTEEGLDAMAREFTEIPKTDLKRYVRGNLALVALVRHLLSWPEVRKNADHIFIDIDIEPSQVVPPSEIR